MTKEGAGMTRNIRNAKNPQKLSQKFLDLGAFSNILRYNDRRQFGSNVKFISSKRSFLWYLKQ
jgi:hypothetical protein